MSSPLENQLIWAAFAAVILVLVFFMLRRTPRQGKLLPESLFTVAADANGVRVVDPSGQERRTSWSYIERLLLRTTDAGPLVPDVFWEVQPVEEPSLVFPGGATGEAEFLRLAQAHLPGFRNDQVIAAMSSTSNREFVVWKHDRYCPRCGHQLPDFRSITHEQRLELRRMIDSSGSINAINRLREMSGCNLRDAKLWVHHRGVAGQAARRYAACR